MKWLAVAVVLMVLGVVCLVEGKGGLQIGVKKRPETCEMRTKKGDRLSMHYTVRHFTDWYIVVYCKNGRNFNAKIMCLAHHLIILP